MKKGFTLVELSIVLVIIGLLIGGILVAQSMVNTSQITKTVKQLQELNVAITNFYTKYNGIPGDSSVINCTWGNCDDGSISGGFVSREEAEWFWPALSIGVNYNTKNGTSYQKLAIFNTNPTPNSTNCLTFAIGQQSGGSANGFPCLLGYFENTFIYQNWITEVSVWGSTTDPLLASEVLAIDSKIDDGLAVAPSASNSKVMYGAKMGSASSGSCTSGTAYVVSNSSRACSIFFYLDGIAPSVGIKRF